MKRLVGILAVLSVLTIAGCNSVWMNTEYTGLLTSTSQLSTETAQRAVDGKLSPSEMTDSLVYQARVWDKFVKARLCQDEDTDPNFILNKPTPLVDLAPPPSTQPVGK